MRMNLKHSVWILAIAGSMAAFAADEIKVADRLDASADTLTDMMKASDKGIPKICSIRRTASLSFRA